MADYTIAQILATTLGETPSYPKLLAMVQHLQTHESDISTLQGLVGGTAGWGAAIDSRWQLAETSASASAYTATVAYASGEALFTGLRFLLYDINQNNTGAATFNIGTTDGAVNIKKIDSTGAVVALAADDLDANRPADIFYDGTQWILLNPVVDEPTIPTSVNVISKSANYSIVVGDLTNYDHLVVLVDCSTGGRLIDLPAPSVYSGKTITIKADAVGGGNFIRTKKSGGANFHESYAVGDFITVTSDGTNDVILDEDVTVKGMLAITSDESFSASANRKVFDASYSEEQDVGGWWDAVTNDRLNIKFDCRIEIIANLMGSANLVPRPYVNGSSVFDVVNGSGDSFLSYQDDLSSGDYFEQYVYNSAGASKTLSGDAAKDETQLYWRVIKRLR